MEEKEVQKPQEEQAPTEEQANLSKEEILAKSRAENKHGDEREMQSLYRAAYLATAIGFLLYGIINIVLAILDRHSFEMNIVTFATLGTMYLLWGIKTSKHKKLFLAAGIVCLATAIISSVGWILELCGV